MKTKSLAPVVIFAVFVLFFVSGCGNSKDSPQIDPSSLFAKSVASAKTMADFKEISIHQRGGENNGKYSKDQEMYLAKAALPIPCTDKEAVFFDRTLQFREVRKFYLTEYVKSRGIKSMHDASVLLDNYCEEVTPVIIEACLPFFRSGQKINLVDTLNVFSHARDSGAYYWSDPSDVRAAYDDFARSLTAYLMNWDYRRESNPNEIAAVVGMSMLSFENWPLRDELFDYISQSNLCKTLDDCLCFSGLNNGKLVEVIFEKIRKDGLLNGASKDQLFALAKFYRNGNENKLFEKMLADQALKVISDREDAFNLCQYLRTWERKEFLMKFAKKTKMSVEEMLVCFDLLCR